MFSPNGPDPIRVVHPGQYFRAGAGLAIVNKDGLVLAFERIDVEGAWQLPQGGLEAGEEPYDAALREIAEESGITGDDLVLLERCPEPLAYELPASARSEKTGRGQVGYWFLFRFTGDERTIDVRAGGEFRGWKWVRFGALVEGAAEFRRPVYRRLEAQFRRHLAPV